MLLALYHGSTSSDHAPSIDRFFSREAQRELLPASVFVCERSAGGLAGFLELSVRNYAEGCGGEVPYVESWYVDPDVRGTGIGARLMGAAEDWARAAGYEEIASDTTLDNPASQRAHEALGFEEIERSVHFRKKLRARPT